MPIPTDYLPASAEELSALPPELQEYYRIWQEAKEAIPQEAPDLETPPAPSPLPPSPRQLRITPELFHKSQLRLLKCIAVLHRDKQERPRQLEELLCCHAVQEQLCRIYHAADQMQRGGSSGAIKELLDAQRLLSRYASAEGTRAFADSGEARHLSDALAPWIVLWHEVHPLLALGGEWSVTGGDVVNWHYFPADEVPKACFSSPADSTPDVSAMTAVSSGSSAVCLHRLFERPALAPGQQLHLITPRLPKGTRLAVNGLLLALDDTPEDGQDTLRCQRILLNDVIDTSIIMQRISVQMPSNAVGTPILPLCLGVSTPKVAEQ